jgi:lipopolysaccharide export LptBFGC system permease protein LptF
MEETFLGPSNRRAQEIRHVIRGGSPETFDVLQRRWLIGNRGEIYYYQWFDPKGRQISALSVYEFSEGMERITRRSYVHLATWKPSDDEDPLDLWQVENGWTREFDETGEEASFTPFVLDTRRLETASYFGAEQPDARFMGYTALREYIKVLAASGFDVLQPQVAVARKLAFPFITIVMTLLAVPFAVTIGRSGAMGGIGVGIALAITYWTVISIFGALGTGGALSPILAAWAPNLLFASAAAYLLLTVRT